MQDTVRFIVIDADDDQIKALRVPCDLYALMGFVNDLSDEVWKDDRKWTVKCLTLVIDHVSNDGR